MKRPWRRRNYFIKKDLQGKYVFNFFIFLVIGAIIFTFIFSALTAKTLTVVYEDYNLKIGKTPLVLLKEILKTHWFFILTFGILVVLISIFLTHRFAGPMYRFEKSIEEMIKGNFSLFIRLRKRDEGKELANLINELNSMLSSRIKQMKDINYKIGKQIEDLREKINKKVSNEDIEHAINDLSNTNKDLGNLLDKFKIKDVD